MATITRVLTTSGAFVIPADFASGSTLQVECIGSGNGNGAGGSSGNGGGGGAYAKTNAITGLAAGNTVYISAGSATDSWFNKAANSAPSTTVNGCLAKGTTGTSGGSSVLSVGDLKYAGGDGGGISVGCPYDFYGGVGGAAGPNGAGAKGGPTGTGGGGGANGGSASTTSTGGNNRFGTGGGTSGNNGTNGGGGGKGAGGAPELIWTDSISSVQYGPCGGSGGGDGSGGNPTGAGGGGACRTADINTSASQNGIVVLTYTSSAAAASTSNFFMFF
jgi:hypothetical protein